MSRGNIHNLIQRLAAEEAEAADTTFLAPCVPGAKLRVRVAGIVRTYRPEPRDYEGWGLFRATNASIATREDEARLPAVARYLDMLNPMRVRLVEPMRGQTWLAYPMNESDWKQRIGEPRPIPIHLVDEGAAFEVIVARWDGAAFWFEQLDRKADPIEADALRRALQECVLPEVLQRKGLTPEARTAYDIATQRAPGFESLRAERSRRLNEERGEGRLDQALRTGGGTMHSHQDRGDFWLVEWTDRSGRRHTSAIGKDDLTVISSGICLSSQDRDFDLASLVGVMDGRYDWE